MDLIHNEHQPRTPHVANEPQVSYQRASTYIQLLKLLQLQTTTTAAAAADHYYYHYWYCSRRHHHHHLPPTTYYLLPTTYYTTYYNYDSYCNYNYN